MNHLQEAKDANDATRELLAGDLQAFQLYRIAHALIAIAEQLENIAVSRCKNCKDVFVVDTSSLPAPEDK